MNIEIEKKFEPNLQLNVSISVYVRATLPPDTIETHDSNSSKVLSTNFKQNFLYSEDPSS